jgi:Mn-dependent DtxR family transcriptional regulator
MSLMQALLDMVSKENLATPAMLAQHLNVSQALVKLMLADLERSGYLRAVANDGSHCAGCGLRRTCQRPEPRLWVRTDK